MGLMKAHPDSQLVIVALGGNLGSAAATLRAVMGRLQSLAGGEFRASSLWETTPVDCPPGSPPFVNAVVAFTPRAGETPQSLLATLQALEQESGRRPKKIMNEARPLDLDLIAFGDEVRSTPALILPHPRAHLRRFVLQPLAEITPELVLPGQSHTVRELLAQLRSAEQVRRRPD
jgi:2-amino-4-hydroxy-6-hydroxymethyldihydropteridine diphosphokinase